MFIIQTILCLIELNFGKVYFCYKLRKWAGQIMKTVFVLWTEIITCHVKEVNLAQVVYVTGCAPSYI
jgi:hypothetical protein